jgi:hypothetical protein
VTKEIQELQEQLVLKVVQELKAHKELQVCKVM